jgi:hypothetical protein
MKELKEAGMIRTLIKHKLFFQRGWANVGCLGVAYLVAEKLQGQLLEYYGYAVPIKVLLPLGVFALWLIGLIDYAIGAWKADAEFIWEVNPKQKELTDAVHIQKNS